MSLSVAQEVWRSAEIFVRRSREVACDFLFAPNKAVSCGHSHNQSVCQQYVGRICLSTDRMTQNRQLQRNYSFALASEGTTQVQQPVPHIAGFFLDHLGVGHVSSQRIVVYRFGSSGYHLDSEFCYPQSRHYSSAH